MASDVRAGAAFVELFTKNGKFEKGLRAAQRRLAGFQASANASGAALLRSSALVAAPLVAGVKIFADFEKGLANVATLLDSPDDFLPGFRKGIRQLSVEFGESTETLLGGLFDIVSAGVPAAKALDVLATSTKLAKSGLADTKTVADAITTVLNSYSLSAEDAAQAADLLFTINKKGKTTLEDVASNIGNVASTAALAKVPLNTLGAVLATLTANGLTTAEAVTAANAVILGFVKPGDEAAGVAKSLGFELNAATLEAEGMEGIFKKLQGLPVDVITSLFPNIRGFKGAAVAISKFGKLSENLDAMENSAGAVDTAFKQISKTLSFSLDRLKQSAVLILSIIGEQLAGEVKDFAGSASRLLKIAADWIKRNKILSTTLLKLALGLGLAGGLLLTLGAVAGVAAFGIGGLATVTTLLGVALGVLLNPLTLAAALIVGLGVAAIDAAGATDQAIGLMKDGFSSLKDTALSTFDGIKSALNAGDFKLAAKILMAALRVEFRKGLDFIDKEFGISTASWREVVDGFAFDTTSGLIQAFFAIQSGWAKAVNFMEQGWINFTVGVQSAWFTTIDFIEKQWNKVSKFIDDSVDDVAFAIRTKLGFDEAIEKKKEADAKKKAAGEEKGFGQSNLERLERQLRFDSNRSDQALADKLNDIQQARNTLLAGLAESQDKGLDDGKEGAAGVSEAEADLAAAQKELAALIAQAKRAESDSLRDAEEVAGEDNDTQKKLDKLKSDLKKAPEEINLAVKTTVAATTGSFNAFAIARLTGKSEQERIANASEKTAENTRKLEKNSRNSTLVFQ